jgi:hypothetical protein
MANQQDTALRIMILGTNIALLGLGLAQFGAIEFGTATLLLGFLITVAGFAR